jgi:hypothetical protein
VGGLNDAIEGTEIQPTQLQVCQNIDFSRYRRGATRRGIQKWNTSRFKSAGTPLRVLGFDHFATAVGVYKDIFVGLPSGGSEILYDVASGVATPVTWDSNLTAGTLGYPYSFIRIRNRIIATNGDMHPWSWGGTGNAQRVGVEAPAAACVGATGAAGLLNGTYKFVYVFVDGNANVIGAASAASNTVTATDQQIQLTGVTVSTNPRVTKRYIYRTDGSGTAPYYYDGAINNTETTYTTNVADYSLGDQLVEGGQPPKARFIIAKDGVAYYICQPSGSGYLTVYYSNALKPEEVPSSNYLEFETGDGEPILAAYVAFNQIILVKQSTIIHLTTQVTDAGISYQIQTVSSEQGCGWAYALAQMEQFAVMGGQAGPVSYDVNQIQRIADDDGVFPAQGTWDAIGNPDGTVAGNWGKEVRAWHWRDRRQIWFSYMSTAGLTGNDKTLVWNYGMPGAPWSKYTFGFDCAGYWRQNFSNKKTFLITSRDYNGWFFKPDNGYVDRHTGSGTMTGTATAGAATTLTDGAAAFYTTGEGLIGCTIWVKDATDGTTTQEAVITANTGTQITVAAWPTFTPAAGDTYAIGSIETKIKTGRLDPQVLGQVIANPDQVTKQARQLRIRTRDISAAEGATLKNADINMYADGSGSAVVTTTADLSSEDVIANLDNASAAGYDFALQMAFRSVNGGKQIISLELGLDVLGAGRMDNA